MHPAHTLQSHLHWQMSSLFVYCFVQTLGLLGKSSPPSLLSTLTWASCQFWKFLVLPLYFLPLILTWSFNSETIRATFLKQQKKRSKIQFQSTWTLGKVQWSVWCMNEPVEPYKHILPWKSFQMFKIWKNLWFTSIPLSKEMLLIKGSPLGRTTTRGGRTMAQDQEWRETEMLTLESCCLKDKD